MLLFVKCEYVFLVSVCMCGYAKDANFLFLFVNFRVKDNNIFERIIKTKKFLLIKVSEWPFVKTVIFTKAKFLKFSNFKENNEYVMSFTFC